MQTYEGYVEDGKFFPIGLMKRTGPRRAFLTVLDEPAPSPAPEKAEAFIEEFTNLLDDRIPVTIVDLDIDQPEFAKIVTEDFIELMNKESK